MRLFNLLKLFFVVMCISFLFSGASFAFLNEPPGYGDIPWGADYEDVCALKGRDNLVKVGHVLDFELYEDRGEEKRLGKAALDDITYVFRKGKFFGTLIEVVSAQNYADLKSHMTYRYGAGFKTSIGADKYIWNGEDAIMMLSAENKSAALLMASKKLYKAMQAGE